LRRSRNVDGGSGLGALAPFSPLAALQDDTTVFGHTRPAGLDSILLQYFCNGSVGRIFATQFHNGIMERFQIAEWNATRIGLVLLNRFMQQFKVGR
jgi:hypothetical protein